MLLLVSWLAPGTLTCEAAASLEFVTSGGADGNTGGAASHSPSFTADGLHLLFLSEANNLVANDDLNPWTDLFLYSVLGGTNLLVSVDRSGIGGGNGPSWEAAASYDGRFVVFTSRASNLTDSSVAPAVSQVFWRDTVLGITRLVSRTPAGVGGNGASSRPKISADGQTVVFVSEASDLVDQDINRASDVFVWYAAAQNLDLVSRNATGETTGGGASDSASITADGSAVIFRSSAQDLIPLPDNGLAASEIYLRDLKAQTVRRLSEPRLLDPALAQPTRESAKAPAVSPSGRYVAFKLFYSSGRARGVMLVDREQPGSFWLKQWEPLAYQFTEVPLVISEVGPSVACEIQFPFSAATSSDLVMPMILQAGPTNQCSQVSDETAPLSPYLLGCFETLPLTLTRVATVPYKGSPAALSLDFHALAQEFPSSQTTSVSAEIQPWLPSWLDANDNEIRVDALVSGVPGRSPLLRFPLHATAGSLVMQPQGSWIAFDTPVAPDAASDRNGASDVYIVSLITPEIRLVSRRLETLPSRLTHPSATLVVRAMNEEGDRLAFGGAWPALPSLPQNLPFRELLVADSSSAELLPVTGYQMPLPNVTPLPGSPVFGSNQVLVSKWNRVGSKTAVLTMDYTPVGTAGFVRGLTLWFHDLDRGWRRSVGGALGQPPLALSTSDTSYSLDGAGDRLVFQGGDELYLLLTSEGSSSPVLLTAPEFPGPGRDHGISLCPAISPDGRWLAFFTSGRDLFSDSGAPGPVRLCVRELPLGKTRSILTFQDAVISQTCQIVWNAESTVLAFMAPGFKCGVVEPISGTNRSIGGDLTDLHLSASGRYLSATERFSNYPRTFQALRIDLLTNTREVASVAPDGTTPGNGRSHSTQLSPDGNRLFFASDASNLVTGDQNGVTDVFVRNFASRETTLLSRSPEGGSSGNGPSNRPLLSGNGELLVFVTAASDLLPYDFNGREDLAQIRFNEFDSDRDGLPDAWERRFWSSLAVADRSTDTDGDRVSDADEFAQGSNPADPASRVGLDLLPLSNLSGWEAHWSVVPWKRYALQYTDSLIEPHWLDLRTPPLFSTTGSTIDEIASPTGSRFYRLIPTP